MSRIAAREPFRGGTTRKLQANGPVFSVRVPTHKPVLSGQGVSLTRLEKNYFGTAARRWAACLGQGENTLAGCRATKPYIQPSDRINLVPIGGYCSNSRPTDSLVGCVDDRLMVPSAIPTSMLGLFLGVMGFSTYIVWEPWIFSLSDNRDG